MSTVYLRWTSPAPQTMNRWILCKFQSKIWALWAGNQTRIRKDYHWSSGSSLTLLATDQSALFNSISRSAGARMTFVLIRANEFQLPGNTLEYYPKVLVISLCTVLLRGICWLCWGFLKEIVVLFCPFIHLSTLSHSKEVWTFLCRTYCSLSLYSSWPILTKTAVWNFYYWLIFITTENNIYSTLKNIKEL